MGFDPPGDALEFCGRYLTEKMERMYGARLVVDAGPTREIELVRCPYLEDAERYGIEGLRICEAHEAWWDEQTRSISGSPRTRITRRMRDGAPTCLVVVERSKAGPDARR